MDKLFKKKACFAFLYVVTAILIEIISFCVMDMGVIPSFWGIDLAFILGFAVIIFVLPCTAAIVVNGILLLGQAVLAFVNEALQGMSGMVFSFDMLNLAKEVGGAFNSDFVNWWLLAGLLALYAVEMTGLILLHKYIKTRRMHFSRNAVVILLLVCLIGENASMILYHTTVSAFQTSTAADEFADYNDDNLLYTTQFIPSKALKKFGTFGFYFINISNVLNELFGKSTNDTSLRQGLSALDNYFSEGQMSSEAYGDANLYTGSLKGKNIVLIVIESGEWYGINKEYTPTLYEMATQGIAFTEYYARDKTNHSEAMSILGSYPLNSDPAAKLKNAELSFTLPNLLGNLGYTTNYFHANNKSFYNRDVTHGPSGVYGFDTAHFLDDMPALEGCDDEGNVIKKSFYNFDKDALITENYFPEYTHKETGDEAFFTMHMTLSSHGAYDDLLDYGDYPFTDDRYYDTDMTEEERAEHQKKLQEEFSKKCTVKGFEKYYEIIDSYPSTFVADKGIKFSEEATEEARAEEIYLRYKRFQAGMMDLDEAVNSLVYDLARTGQLDDTAFLFYADHTAYYNNQNYYLKGVETGDSWNTDLYNIPSFLWYGGSMNCNVSPAEDFYEDYHEISFAAKKDKNSPLQGGRTIDKFTCSFDILPTILQLAGYDYNLNLYQGVSMFSDLKSIFISRESGIFTDDIYYDGITVSVRQEDGTWKQYDYEGTIYSEEGFSDEVKEFLKASLRYYDKQQMLEEMYKLDYFAKRPIFREVSKEGKIFYYVREYNGTAAV